jgi:hypothetical protein
MKMMVISVDRVIISIKTDWASGIIFIKSNVTTREKAIYNDLLVKGCNRNLIHKKMNFASVYIKTDIAVDKAAPII